MSTALLVITDGRFDYFARTLRSAAEYLPDFDHRVIVDDTAHRLGFAGAIQQGWEQVLETRARWVVHLEDDFVFNGPVPVERMIGVLERFPHLAQIVLKRQAWNDEERAAGGIVEQHPDDYCEQRESRAGATNVWTEHRRFWSTNPSVYSARWCRKGWPQVKHSEGIFTHRLLGDPNLRFAFWGGKFDPPMVEHIGEARAGNGY